ncbi:hypothetical protein [Terrabacter sp. 2RAF25]|uniref:hypothetical protein n=1 Tax=Terrabacter sp. 2RAF25 TaxID=3232998 RepID=UPI003F9A6BC5
MSLALTTGVAATAPASGAVPAATSSSVLAACYNVRALTPNDKLFNSRFVLTAFPDYLQLEEDVTFPGELETAYVTYTWTRTNPNPPTYATDRSYLALHCNGDLAFRRSNGTLLWHSNTANRGVTRLVLTAGGNLTLLDAAGRMVWQSGTGRSTMPANSVLPSNAKLTSDRNVELDGKRDSLSMQTDGNLVYRRGSRVAWQSDTHVPGSHAGLTTRGQLVVVTPGGRYLWASHPTGSRRTVLDVGAGCVCDLENHLLPVWGFPG